MESGAMVWPKELEHSTTLTAMFTKENFFKIVQMASECTSIRMDKSMKDTGKMTCKRAKEKKSSRMAASTTDSSRAVRSGDLELTYGLTHLFTLASGSITTSKDRENTSGLMVESTKECGAKTNFMVWVFILGQTEESTRESIRMIRNTDMEFTPGPMAKSTTVVGRMESNTVKLDLPIQRTAQSSVSGKMERK
jgi:hypothetical protein